MHKENNKFLAKIVFNMKHVSYVAIDKSKPCRAQKERVYRSRHLATLMWWYYLLGQ